ncbi:hypothetical protein C804_01113 [Lachnospiraceae bacterium A4]|nr:hypothetical protein C804_01113 [Lachnospiraceae bacterium A4]
MINYIRMKRAEWKIKATLYNAIAAFIDNQKEILELLQKIYIAFKDVSAEDLQKEFISKLAEIIHNDNKSNTK